MQIHRHTKKLRSVAEYLLIFVIVFTVSTVVFRVKDRIETARLEKASANVAEVDKNITTITSSNTYVWKIDVDDIPKADDADPPHTQTTHVLRKIMLLSLGGLGIIVIVVRRGGENERHHKGK